MSHRQFTPCFPWDCYSKKLVHKIENPRHGGFFLDEEAKVRGMRLVACKQGDLKKGSVVALYFLIDESDGVIADAKFQVFGPSPLIGAAEVACEILIRKNYDQARRLTADLIDKQVRDKNGIAAFPEETFAHLNLVIDAIEQAAEQCVDIPLDEAEVSTPLETKGEDGEGYPGWNLLNREQKIGVIEEVISTEIRPYIELDAGGVQIVDLIHDRELIIAYEGACSSCHSATGATLNAIQEILRAKVDKTLLVVPDPSFLNSV
ncbi:MAG: NifU family protein [Rhabdochlamydiaceae bacterium]|jgi:NifU-like protein